MALAFDAVTVGSGDGSTTSFSHTVTGSNPILFAAAEGRVGGANDITAVSYNSVSLTKVAEALVSGDRWLSLWYLINPATGAHTISFTGGAFVVGSAISYTGARQSSQPDSFNNPTTSSSTSFAASTTVVATNCWTLAVVKNGTTGGGSAGSGTTLRGGSNDMQFGDSNGIVSSGSQTLNFTSSSGNWAGIVVSIAATTSVVATSSGFFRAAMC